MTLNLLSALAAYIPRDRVEALLAPHTSLATDGVAMIADISGFTPLTEALTQGLRPDQGAEELTRALGAVFTPLITQIHAFRGSVMKFGGDALIIWFGRERKERRSAVIRRAVTAAWQMQQQMQTVGQVPTPIGLVTLKMKIGLAYGPVKRFNLGLPEYGYEDVLAGATLDRMAEAEHHAGPDDIVTDARTLSFVKNSVVVDWRDGFVMIRGVIRPFRTQPWENINHRLAQIDTDLFLERLSAYVPRQIVEMLEAGRGQVAELKPVVSLFVQFHGLDYDQDPEIANKLQTYFVTVQQVVARYNGRLNRLITGDKGSLLHIIFGAPRSVEEQEARAVRCALDVQAECGRLPFITMQRIGVAAGRAFAGPVGSPMRHDYTVMGDTINLSARLMQNAADNQVLLDSAVRAQLGDAFELADLGDIRVKGKAEPIHVYAPLSVREVTRQIRQLEPLFGRERETAVLQHHIRLLATGQGGIAFVVGDVGMGKTLLLDSLRAQTAVRWVSGISLAYGETLRGYLFIDLLRHLLDLPSGATPEQAGRELAKLCRQLFGAVRLEATYPYLAKFMGLPLPGDLAQRLEGLGGESLRWQLFQLIPELFSLLSRRQPLVLALDDLQWADPTSLHLLELLWPLAAGFPLLLILAMRPEQQSRAWGLRAEILTADGRPPTADLVLQALDETAATRLITYHLPGLPQRVVDYLVEKGGGNPLFLVEMVHTLQLRGLLSGGVDLNTIALDALDLPNSVQGLLLAQLDRLAVETRHTLQLASVIGKTFLDQVLVTMAGAEKQVMARLSELEQQAYVQPDGRSDLGPSHTFRHILIQESAYSTLLYEHRRAYHRQAAEALEHLFPAAIAEQAAFLAHHYEQAEDLDQAIYYYQQTADQARLLYAHEEAEALYDKILTLFNREGTAESTSTSERRAKTFLKLAQVRANTLDFAGAQVYYEQAFALLEEQKDRATHPQQIVADREKSVLRWGILPEYAKRFDPGLAQTVEAAEIIANLFEGLVELDNDLNVIPAVARHWQVSEGGRLYHFTLRDSLKWSDGEPLTADDFVFAWRRNLSPATKAEFAYQLYLVQGAEAFHTGQNDDPQTIGITAVNDSVLEIRLNTPANYFPYLLADPITYPQPAHLINAKGDAWSLRENLVCNGTFRIDRADVDSYIRLSRNPFYRGFSMGNLEIIHLYLVHPGLEQYHARQIDWCRVDNRLKISDRLSAETYLVQSFATFLLGFGCHLVPFTSKWVRQAFACSVNTQELVQQVWANTQRAASGGVIPPGMPGHSPEIGIRFDPQKAQTLLHRAGFTTGKELPPLTLATLPGFGQTPYYLRNTWQEILGVVVNIVEDVPADHLLKGLSNGLFQLVLVGYYAAYPDPDDSLRGLFHSANSANYFHWYSRPFDEVVEQALETTDPWKRLELYRQADQLLISEEAAVMPLYYLQAYGLLRSRFSLADTGRVLRSGIRFKNVVAQPE